MSGNKAELFPTLALDILLGLMASSIDIIHVFLTDEVLADEIAVECCF